MAAVFVVQTPRSRIIDMSTSGSRERDSAAIHATTSTSESANRPITRAEPQPQVGPWLAPSSSATSHDERRAAPTQFTRPPGLSGDSGTNRCVATAATTVGMSGSQKSQW